MLIHDMKHVGIKMKFYNLDTFKRQTDVNFIDLDSELVDLNYKVAYLIFCHFWRSISSILEFIGSWRENLPVLKCLISLTFETKLNARLALRQRVDLL